MPSAAPSRRPPICKRGRSPSTSEAYAATGVGTPVKGGLDYREAHMVMEMVADSGLMTSLDLVEVNPVLDNQNQTATLGAELALSALGMKIL